MADKYENGIVAMAKRAMERLSSKPRTETRVPHTAEVIGNNTSPGIVATTPVRELDYKTNRAPTHVGIDPEFIPLFKDGRETQAPSHAVGQERSGDVGIGMHSDYDLPQDRDAQDVERAKAFMENRPVGISRQNLQDTRRPAAMSQVERPMSREEVATREQDHLRKAAMLGRPNWAANEVGSTAQGGPRPGGGGKVGQALRDGAFYVEQAPLDKPVGETRVGHAMRRAQDVGVDKLQDASQALADATGDKRQEEDIARRSKVAQALAAAQAMKDGAKDEENDVKRALAAQKK